MQYTPMQYTLQLSASDPRYEGGSRIMTTSSPNLLTVPSLSPLSIISQPICTGPVADILNSSPIFLTISTISLLDDLPLENPSGYRPLENPPGYRPLDRSSRQWNPRNLLFLELAAPFSTSTMPTAMSL
ncbi:uncharacterized protein PGTG_06653 [Puccinia graminis f. sp. tritici CRL 75-36-700-3]|uniref:Uncharacterized protein n=1 Tax=Puccinia graminis f. sp. tritici (strain CRL 75-36-700-3 / race SCCL) TaxID=418459 RepID=E3K879_PUCGT|nr:uncharacterized protein PGTG_06653 [Puccinia graminis f. sp. tritici CRL 75-36-700-3]EFP80697.1 hypothetical protein PGTG_06653 [Puccinia graminis f. sp. tritici CRL 75-36-700-3]